MAFKKKTTNRINKKILKINPEHVIRAVEQYLLANSLWDDGKAIVNIQFNPDGSVLEIQYRKEV